MRPRIPLPEDFQAFSDAGRALGERHLNYETVEPYALTKDVKRLMMEAKDWRVSKMAFGKQGGKPDKSVIGYNENVTLRRIPLEAYDYVVYGKSAVVWILDRYRVSVDKASQIWNALNDWSEDPRYIVDLLKRIVRVSVESVRMVNNLPPLNEAK